MYFDVDYKSPGWVSIGFGNNMANAKMVLAFTNEYGSPDITVRTSYSRTLPMPDSIQDIQIMTSAIPNRNEQIFSFALQADEYFRRGYIPMIYAYNMQQVWGNNVRMHSDFGFIPAIDLYQDYYVPNYSLTHMESAIIHGILMFVAWYLLCSSGIFVARFMKARLGIWWFRVHFGLFGLAILLTVTGFVIIYMGESWHFHTLHSYIGLFILIFSFCQGLLGIGIDRLFNPNRESIPWYDKAHWWLGRVLYFLAIVNMFLGLNDCFEGTPYKGATLGTLSGLVVLMIILFIVAHKKLGQSPQFHRESIQLDNVEK